MAGSFRLLSEPPRALVQAVLWVNYTASGRFDGTDAVEGKAAVSRVPCNGRLSIYIDQRCDRSNQVLRVTTGRGERGAAER